MSVKTGIVGYPITHSRSPLIHEYWMHKHKVAGSYEKRAIQPEDNFRDEILKLRDQGFVGVNVTVPHKETAFSIADDMSSRVLFMKAANTLHFQGAQIFADNSDSAGFLAALAAAQAEPIWKPFPVMVLGAGGAARAIIAGLADIGVADILLANRNKPRALALADEFSLSKTKITICDWGQRADYLKECRLLINATSLGMQKSPPLDLSLAGFAAQSVVMDIVYTPLHTPLLQRAQAAGHIAIDGLGMLLHQAVPAFEIWHGVRPVVTDELRQRVIKDLEA